MKSVIEVVASTWPVKKAQQSVKSQSFSGSRKIPIHSRHAESEIGMASKVKLIKIKLNILGQAYIVCNINQIWNWRFKLYEEDYKR